MYTLPAYRAASGEGWILYHCKVEVCPLAAKSGSLGVTYVKLELQWNPSIVDIGGIW